VADGWCWFVLREEYCWLVADGWFVLREKYCWLLVAGFFETIVVSIFFYEHCGLVTIDTARPNDNG
jgi:hypothetical protein